MRKNTLNFKQLRAGKHGEYLNYPRYFRWLIFTGTAAFTKLLQQL